MGQRKRNGQTKLKHKRHTDSIAANRKFTRRRALKALALGAEPSEERFVKHDNYHVRARAWRKMGSPLPENEGDKEKFLKDIHQWRETPIA